MGDEQGDGEGYGGEPAGALERQGDHSQQAESDDIAEQDGTVEGVERDGDGATDDGGTKEEVACDEQQCQPGRHGAVDTAEDGSEDQEGRRHPGGAASQVAGDLLFGALGGQHDIGVIGRGAHGTNGPRACQASRREATSRSRLMR